MIFLLWLFFHSQLLYDGFTESAQHLATNLVTLSSLTQCVSSNELLELYKTRGNGQGNLFFPFRLGLLLLFY